MRSLKDNNTITDQSMRTDNNKAINKNHQQGEDDEDDDEETATAAIGEGNDCVGSICILLVLVSQRIRIRRNQINDIKLM